jgi:hypothetical protein
MYRQKQPTVPIFLTEQNVSMLLEIILDEDFMQVQSSDVIEATKFVFYNNIRGFYENEKANVPDLVELNKQYIMLILRHVKSDLINKPPPVNTNKQRVTFEEIQKDKRSQFERDLNARQSEFTSAMTLPVPPVPKFSDAAQDEPLSEMELAIKQMTEQRKYDVDQITNSFTGNTLAPPEETSINNEKFRRPIIKPGMQPQAQQTQAQPQKQPQSQQNPGIRYIKIENAEAKLDDAAIVDLTKRDDDSSSFERNIFSKLKKVDDSAVLSNLQNEVKELGAKVETINRDISKILDLLSNPK